MMTKRAGVKPRTVLTAALFAAFLFAGFGCGKKAPPVPPPDSHAGASSLSGPVWAPGARPADHPVDRAAGGIS